MQTASSPVAPSPSPAGPLHVLIADDNRTNQVVLTYWLAQAGHTSKTVDDGEAALDALEGDDFDLAIMDLNMPNMSGAEATQLYRVISTGRPHLPIIGLTADTTSGAAQLCADAGMDTCLTKPVDRVRLLEVISQITRVVSLPTPSIADAVGMVGVTAISSHPQFKAGLGPPPADEFNTLSDVGDLRMMREITRAFQADATAVLGYLAAAVDSSDARSFRTQALALRGSASAISASRLDALCLSSSRIESGDLRLRGKELIAQISREIDRVCNALRQRC